MGRSQSVASPIPAGHVLTWQMNPVAVFQNGLLPVERKMIAILAYDDLRLKPGCRNATLLGIDDLLNNR